MSELSQHIKYLLSFSVKEQLAIIVIVLFMIMALAISFFPDMISPKPEWDFNRLDSLVSTHYANLKQLDSIQRSKSRFNFANPDASALEQKFNLFMFNPNMMSESEWQRLGMAAHQIRMIKNYERSGGKFLRKEDLRKIYSVSDAEYKMLEPYIVIPPLEKPLMSAVEDSASTAIVDEGERYEIPIVELNSASPDDLVQLPQIGKWYAKRIIQYRNSLGGFIHASQLLEVYRMDSARKAAFTPYITIDTTLVNRVIINSEDFSELLSHPYISFELTRLVVNHRERRGMLKSWNELMQLPGADTLIHGRLRPYLDFN